MWGGDIGQAGTAWHKDVLNSWTPENTNTNVPAIMTAGEYNYANATSDRFMISSDYLALNNISVGYTLPAKFTKKFGVAELRVYGAAENVALWAKRKGMDPRQSYISSYSSTYSPIRSISGGVKVSF